MSVNAQSCPTLCDPMGRSPSCSSVHAIFQVRTLEWVAISSSGDLRHPGIKPVSLVSPALASVFFTDVPPGKSVYALYLKIVLQFAFKFIISCLF